MTPWLEDGPALFGPNGGSAQGSLASAQAPVPPGPNLTARDFSVVIDQAIPAGRSSTIAFMVNGVEAFACTMPAGTTGGCTDPDTTTVSLAPGDKINWRMSGSGYVGPPFPKAGFSLRLNFAT